MGVVAAIGGAIIGGVSHVKQQKQQKKALKAQQESQRLALESQERANAIQQKAVEESNRLRKKQADISTHKQRVASIREARIKRGALVATAAAGGTAGSSGFLGANSSISSQLTGGLAYGSTVRDTATQLGDLEVSTSNLLGQENIFSARAIGEQNNIAANAQSKAATLGAIGGVASGVFDQAGGFKTIFKAVQ